MERVELLKGGGWIPPWKYAYLKHKINYPLKKLVNNEKVFLDTSA